VVADTVSGQYSTRHRCDLAVWKRNLRPSSHLHPILDATLAGCDLSLEISPE
jgi:hypothetical protein